MLASATCSSYSPMDSYYFSPNPNHDLLYSTIFDPEEEQLLYDLLSNPVSYDPYYTYPLHTQIPSAIPNCQLINTTHEPFQLDFPVLDCNYLPPKRQKLYHTSDQAFTSSKKNVNRQSIAARDRRKKISDKTQELGKLVPGSRSSKMNTAEMLQHAYKYVKFLQAQVSVLELMSSEFSQEQMNFKILASSAVQEKLYMKDKCLVPMDLLEQLAQNQGSISKDLKLFIKSYCVEDCSRI